MVKITNCALSRRVFGVTIRVNTASFSEMKKWLAPQKKHTKSEWKQRILPCFLFNVRVLWQLPDLKSIGTKARWCRRVHVLFGCVVAFSSRGNNTRLHSISCYSRMQEKLVSGDSLSLRYILTVSLDVPVVLVVVYMLHKASIISKCIHLIL